MNFLKTQTHALVDTLLADPSTEEREQQSDRVDGTTGINAALVDQASVRPTGVFNAPSDSVDDFNSMCFDSRSHMLNAQKFILLANGSWASATIRWTRLVSVELPKAFFLNVDRPAFGPSRYFSHMRASFRFRLQVNAAAGVSGGLMLVYEPKGTPTNYVDHTVMMFPHAIINLATTSSCELQIPYVSNNNYVGVDTKDLGAVHVMVLSPVRTPTTSTVVDYSVFGAMEELTLQNPRPYAQNRPKTDIAEGPGMMNLSNCNSTAMCQTLALDGECVKHDPKSVGTCRAIKDVREVLSVRMPLLGNAAFFLWEKNQSPGTPIWKANISFDQVNAMFGMVSNGFRFWRGSLNLTFTIFATPFNKGRVRLIWYPNYKSTKAALTKEQANNALNLVVDIGLNSSATMVVPFAYERWMRETVQASTETVGRLEVQVVNRLTLNINTPQNLECMLTACAGSDFQIMVPCSRGVKYQQTPVDEVMSTQTGARAAVDAGITSLENTGGDPAGVSQTSASGGIDGAPTRTATTILNVTTPKTDIVRAVHSELGVLFGRAQYIGKYAFTTSPDAHAVPLPVEGYMALIKTFCFFSGSYNIHMYNDSAGFVVVSHTYNYSVIAHDDASISANGSVVVPPRMTASVKVPFYSEHPNRLLHGDEPLGTLFFDSSEKRGTVHIWISFDKDSQFSFPCGVPMPATARSMLKHKSAELLLSNPGTHSCVTSALAKSKKSGSLEIDMESEALDLPLHEHREKRPFAKLSDKLSKFFPREVYDLKGLDEDTIAQEDEVLHATDAKYAQAPMRFDVAPPTDFDTWDGAGDPSACSWTKIEVEEDTPTQQCSLLDDMHIGMTHEQLRDAHCKALTSCGDIESNPGPMYPLCRKVDDLSGDQGFLIGKRVFFLKMGDLVQYDSPILCSVALSSQWERTDLCLIHVCCELQGQVVDTISSADDKAYIGENLRLDASDQDKVDVVGTALLFMATLPHCQNDPKTTKQTFLGGFKGMLSKARENFVSFAGSFVSSKMLETLKSGPIKKLAIILCRLVCYGVLFYQSPGIITAATIATLMALDVASVFDTNPNMSVLSDAIMSGDMPALAAAIVGFMVDEDGDLETAAKAALSNLKSMKEMQTQTTTADDLPRPQGGDGGCLGRFNKVTTAAKGVGWWMTKLTGLIEWLKEQFFPDEAQAAMAALKNKENEIAEALAIADLLVLESKTAGATLSPDFQSRRKRCRNKLNAVKVLMTMARYHHCLADVRTMLDKIDRIPMPDGPTQPPLRLEPVALWICSEPRQGKTFVTSLVIKKLGLLSPNDNNAVYFHAIGSNHMDGYRKQTFHVYDDFGQSSKEEEVGNFCQVVSGAPYIIPQAALEDKGMYYDSKYVICTTNRQDFDRFVSVTTPAALQTRFKFKIKIRAKDQYRTASGQLNTLKAEADGALNDGTAWEIIDMNGQYKPFVVDTLVSQMYQERVNRQHMLERLLHGMDYKTVSYQNEIEEAEEMSVDECVTTLCGMSLDSPFETLTILSRQFEETKRPTSTDRFKTWLRKGQDFAMNLANKLHSWVPLIKIFSSIVWATLGAINLARLLRSGNESPPEEHPSTFDSDNVFAPPFAPQTRAYNAMPLGTRPRKTTTAKIQNDPEQWVHITKLCGHIKLDNKDIKPVNFLGWCEHTILVYHHVVKHMAGTFLVRYNGLAARASVESVDVITTDRGKQDLALVKLTTMPFKFKDARKHCAVLDKKRHGYLVSNRDGMSQCMSVRNITPYDTMYIDHNVDGVKMHVDGLRYESITYNGSCGAVLIARIGGAWKVCGLHTAGDSEKFGWSMSLRPLLERPFEQGHVVSKRPGPRLHSASKSAYKPSPLYQIVERTMEPAPLTPRDPRVERQTESLVVDSMDKYSNNRFNVDPVHFDRCVDYLKRKIYATTGLCSEVTWADAINGLDFSNPVDMKTSAGPKYTMLGLKKTDLLFRYKPDEPLHPTDEFLDVLTIKLRDAYEGNITTTFATNLKDEIVKQRKVWEGNPRSIESCDVDYVIVYRKVMGEIYDKIYSSEALATGIAVGINPWVDYHQIFCSLDGNLHALDYKKFDGSLPVELMRAGVEVLAACHDDPDLVRHLHEPVIISDHHVLDEVWTVEGGMPSGAPCTSVLNSICNTLALLYVHSFATNAELSDLKIITYGDDVLCCLPPEVEFEPIAGLREAFGMTATSADKVSEKTNVTWSDATFLKRSFRTFPGSIFVTGVLDIESIYQKIQWMRGLEEFQEQLSSALIEISMHGEQPYQEFVARAQPMLNPYRVLLPQWKVVIAEQYDRLFN
uniref:Genome polyprotein n=1 Tax=Red gurnard picornavirus FL19 TaxID=2813197 RepID=A0A894JIF2_9PICO|nr:MAG: RNA-dependent RNA polymerase [Red gurnard picornavirus FL19]